MRTIPILLTAALAAAACKDALGPEDGCRDEMNAIRQQRGAPDQTHQEESDGDYFANWTYFPTGSDGGAAYLFRWGVSYDICVVDGPSDFDVIPEGPGAVASSLSDAPPQGSALLDEQTG